MPGRGPYGAGERDRWVTIQHLTESQGNTQYPVEAWDTLMQVWASKEPLRGAERFIFAADQESAPYDTRWEIPYHPDMDPELVDVPKKRRLLIHSRIHDIVAAEEIGRKRAVLLMTTAGGLIE